MSFCKDCVAGVRHEGNPEGSIEKIGGVDCYVATPSVDYPKDKVVLILTDIFGIKLNNNLLLADDFARNGFKTIIPDYLNGDAAPADGLSGNTGFNLQEWFKSHGREQTRPPLDRVISALKESGITTFGAAGYCFGGRYVFDLAFENIIKAAVVSHPSLLQLPEDLKTYASSSRAPLLINSCTHDTQFPLTASAQADEILGEGKFAPGYKREYYEGQRHGFSVRGDMSVPAEKEAKEAAFKATVEWLAKHL